MVLTAVGSANVLKSCVGHKELPLLFTDHTLQAR